MVGRTLDRYRLLEQVGHGGMAVVYRALDLDLEREVAVKVLHPHLADQPESRARLQREAQAVAKLRHENILQIYSCHGGGGPEERDSACYLVTEFVRGQTLRGFLSQHPHPLPEVGAMIIAELCGALGCAHQAGIIHRDVKPENVMIREAGGAVVLCDFGIAQVVDKERMTVTGQLLGSPAYMAPEHVDGQPLDARTDLFSLGVMLYELVCGELPFRGRNPHETLKKIAEGTYVPAAEREPQCSARLSRIIDKALAREPAARYPEAQRLLDDLLGYLQELDISDVRAELAAYFQDPAAWHQAYRPRLQRSLRDAGLGHRREGRVAAALSLWSRGQLLCPSDAEFPVLIRGVTRLAARRRLLRGAGLALLLGLVVLGGAGLLGRLRAPPAPASPPDAAVAPGIPADLSAPPDLREAAPPPLPPVKPRLRRLRLSPWPKAVRVSLNGRPLGEYGVDLRVLDLPPGPSEILLENPACFSEKVRIGPREDPGEVRVRLRWKPATLLVRATPADADLVVDGQLLGRAGQVMAIPVRSDDGRRTVEVKISAAGHRSLSRTVELRANQQALLEEALQPSGGG